jgi:hypothetical protein
MSPGKRFVRFEVATKLVCSGLLGISSPKEEEVTAAQAAAQVVAVEVVVNDPEGERKVQAPLVNRAERVRRRANLRRGKPLRVELERMQLLLPQRHQRQRQRLHSRRVLQLRNKLLLRVVVAVKADAVAEVVVPAVVQVVEDRAAVVSVGDGLSPQERIASFLPSTVRSIRKN